MHIYLELPTFLLNFASETASRDAKAGDKTISNRAAKTGECLLVV